MSRMGGAAGSGQLVNIINSDIQLSRTLLERLVIVDDSIITYNAYKSKVTFLTLQTTPSA